MAFNDSPIIDQYSRNSEKSERRLKGFLNQEAGFICRPEVPDKGCDFDTELILQETKSSSWKFPIQLKSTEKLSLIEGQKFISLSFETSRLGYLMRRIPSMGIIVLYSVEEDRCFYEYADKIYNRLMEDRISEDWKSTGKVNIHIPYANVLTTKSAHELHETFTIRFEQALKMQNSHGAKYGLPTVSLTDDFQYDFYNIHHIKRFLSEYGLLLLYNYDLDIIHKMIIQIPNLEIYGNKDLLLIAAVSYAESGMHTDSQLFCTKLSKQQLSDSEKLMLQFVMLKNKLALGYINTEEFLEELEKLNTNDIDDQNKITIEINLVHYKLAQQKAFEDIPETVVQSIDNIFTLLDKSNCNERTRGLLTLWNCENLSYLISSIAADRFGKMQIKESLGNPMSLDERINAVKEITTLNTRFDDILVAVNKKASLNNDKFLKAYSLSIHVKHFIHHQINFYSFEFPVNQMEHFTKRIINTISFAATAYNYFLELNIYKEAYDSLCNMIEVIELAEQGYQIQSPHDKTGLYETKQQMEVQLDILSRPIIFTKLISDKKMQTAANENGMAVLKDLNDDQIESLAKTSLSSFGLPKERLVHIVNEMKAYRMFHQRCTDKNILILQFKTDYEAKNIYALPIRFVLRSKLTGLETAPSADIAALLSSWRF